MNSTEYAAIMDRMEGRMLHYLNNAARCKMGQKQYTAMQMEYAKARAMQEARLIVWMHLDGEEVRRPFDASESQRIAAGLADEKPDGQAENVKAVAPATLDDDSTNNVMAG